MDQTFTETSESNSALLSGLLVTNYDPSALNLILLGGLTLAVVSNATALENTARMTMFASETILSREWLSPREDQAWADL
jgi:hypothetical protein